MSDALIASIVTAAITTSGTVLVAIVALIQNSKRFDEMGKRIDRIEKQLDIMMADLKEFYKQLGELDKRVQRMEDSQSK